LSRADESSNAFVETKGSVEHVGERNRKGPTRKDRKMHKSLIEKQKNKERGKLYSGHSRREYASALKVTRIKNGRRDTTDWGRNRKSPWKRGRKRKKPNTSVRDGKSSRLS